MNGPRPEGDALRQGRGDAHPAGAGFDVIAPSPLHNGQGRISGAKSVLWLACALCVAWLLRDLLTGRDLSETHAALLGSLLAIGLINRLSARGHLKIRLGRDGAEFTSGREGRPD